MPLAPNFRLGHYEIKSTLGVGGMGEVYRARDSHLNRDVAIKVLHEAGATSADQRSRFEREAHAVAALNHPNIVAIHDFGIEAGQQYIVSELIEGESLRAILTGKPVPVRKLLDIATQVADGLSAAHAAGIVHRDLKPENIMLTREGRVKILDFGLARHTPVAGKAAGKSGLETTAYIEADAVQQVTSQGTVMGTAKYMSPEQAAGTRIDFRTDQFSLGLILYEMACGKQAFAKPSAVETMAAIVRDDPPPMDERLPAPLRWTIDRCLAKEPEQRYESTRDLYQELRNLRDHFSEAYVTITPTPADRQKKRRTWIVASVINVGCLLLGGLLIMMSTPYRQDIGGYRYTPFAHDAANPIWSPDGKAITYSSAVNGADQVFLRYLRSTVPVQLTHEKNGVAPLGWSSDRNHLIVMANPDDDGPSSQKIESVPAVGGDLDFIMNADCSVCDVSRDGKALAVLARSKTSADMYSVSISDPFGSPLRPYLPAPFATKEMNEVPQLLFSPDGKKILLFLAGENLKEEAWLLPYPAGGKPPQRILQKLPVLRGTPTFSWMPDSRHIVVELQAYLHSPTHLWLADTESNDLTPLTTGNASEWSPAVAPDGKSLLYVQTTSSFDVASLSVNDGSSKTLITTGRQESMPAWSRNTEDLAWVTNRSGPGEIWVRSADQVERPAVTSEDFPDAGTRWFMNPSLSPDSKRLIFTRVSSTGVTRLWMVSLSGGSPVRLSSDEPSSEFGGAWSPDGSRYVYLQTLAGNISLMTVKTSGNAAPVELKKNVEYYLPDWSTAGDWITFRDEKGWSMISSGGKATQFLGKIETDTLAFSRDGKLLYGVQNGESEADRDRATFFSLDPATLKQKAIRELGKDLRPSSNVSPGVRLSLAPDGKSFAYTTEKTRNDLWMLQGYQQPGWLTRFIGALR